MKTAARNCGCFLFEITLGEYTAGMEDTSPETPKSKSDAGSVVSLLIIVGLIVFAAYYVWQERTADKTEETTL